LSFRAPLQLFDLLASYRQKCAKRKAQCACLERRDL
jgi:hypothetical protein